jgi:prephenate dehydratase
MVAASGERDSGVIASDRAAEIYGLNIILEKIQARLLLQVSHDCLSHEFSN